MVADSLIYYCWSFRMFLEDDVTIKYWIFFFPKVVLVQIGVLSVVQQ